MRNEHFEADQNPSEKKFATAFYTSPEAINIIRLKDGLYLDINQDFTDVTGYTREDVLGKTSYEVVKC